LAPGGILVLPVGPENNQILKKITFNNGEFTEVDYTEVSFVPMLAGLNK
jgi:protein-L-isoaspartate O-methyltransferase